MGRAWAENAVIISDDGTTVKFHPQCPKCGDVNTGTTGSGYCSHGSSMVGYFSCYCGHDSFPVTIHRD